MVLVNNPNFMENAVETHFFPSRLDKLNTNIRKPVSSVVGRLLLRLTISFRATVDIIKPQPQCYSKKMMLFWQGLPKQNAETTQLRPP